MRSPPRCRGRSVLYDLAPIPEAGTEYSVVVGGYLLRPGRGLPVGGPEVCAAVVLKHCLFLLFSIPNSSGIFSMRHP